MFKIAEKLKSSVIINCEDTKRKEKLITDARTTLVNKYTVVLVDFVKPKLKVFRVKNVDAIADRNLVEQIVKQNKFEKIGEFSMVVITRRLNKKYIDATVLLH